MTKRISVITVPSLGAIDRSTGHIGQQLIRALRSAIAKGELKPGEQLPSTRALSISLGLARGTVTEAFEQLKAEGYLDANVGAGTRVSVKLDAETFAFTTTKGKPPRTEAPPLPPNVSRYEGIAQKLRPQEPVPFAIAIPVGAIAPDENWRRLGNRVRASTAAAPATYGDPRGVRELRIAVADYVRKSRAVICEPEQVIMTAGTQQGLFLSASVLLSRGDAVWAEDPAYPGLTAVLANFDCELHRVPVDGQGLDVQQGIDRSRNARAAFVTPSHQYPLGMPLSMPRRFALVAWARENNGWIVEDDYDSELRYVGHPFPSLQGLDPNRVVYLGTFSKVLFPSLRIGYIVVPKPLIDAFVGARAIIDRHLPTVEQYALAAYMREGHFEAHIRRIRNIYSERRTALLDALDVELPSWAKVEAADQGMHVVISLPEGVDDVRVMETARGKGLAVRAISPMYQAIARPSGLMLGFGGFTAPQLTAAAKRFREVLDGFAPRR